MTKEEAMKILIGRKQHYEMQEEALFLAEAMDVAIECVEKQIPQKCKHNLPRLNSKYNYCPFCGRRIDWEV